MIETHLGWRVQVAKDSMFGKYFVVLNGKHQSDLPVGCPDLPDVCQTEQEKEYSDEGHYHKFGFFKAMKKEFLIVQHRAKDETLFMKLNKDV